MYKRQQRDIADASGLSLGVVNREYRELADKGLVDEAQVTPAGFTALSPYRVENAVIMAAGLSSRFAPLSYERPKGVLKVRGEVLVERQIRQLKEAGIDDIAVVVGYMKEQFFYLEDAFGVDIVVNEDYACLLYTSGPKHERQVHLRSGKMAKFSRIAIPWAGFCMRQARLEKHRFA